VQGDQGGQKQRGEALADARKQLIKDFLQEFKGDIKQLMDRPVPKLFSNGQQAAVQKYPKNSESFREEDNKAKKQINEEIFFIGQKQGYTRHDNVRNLFDPFDYRDPNAFDQGDIKYDLRELKTEAKLPTVPWSADYWAIAKGQTAHRYADEELEALIEKDYEEHGDLKFSTIQNYKPQPGDFNYVKGLNDERARTEALKIYSPAEKYDILVGDANFSLTNYTKDESARYADVDGFIEGWMGICHGWAPAAYEDDRPLNTIEVTAADGRTKITFYPDEIKALSSLKWAKSRHSSHFIGGRCNIKEDDITEDQKDPKTGKILIDQCFDTNPGTWHLAVTNKIGEEKKSFIMDATFDYEVWNQPVYSYNVTYFNVKESEQKNNLQDAVISLAELGADDKFYGVRSADLRATQVVGVIMEVVYVAENSPNPGKPSDDVLVDVVYAYDLELDANYNIVGGEWYTNQHPDFLWTPKKNEWPRNRIDTWAKRQLRGRKAESIAGLNQLLGYSLTEASRMSVQNDVSPLGAVVDMLIALSSRPVQTVDNSSGSRNRNPGGGRPARYPDSNL